MKRISAFCLFVLLALTARAGDYAPYYRNLPVPLTEPALPSIPDNSLSLTEFGGVGDGLADNTEAFAKAVAALVKQGGGHLVVPAGIWLTGPISLKDHIDLHLEKNAMILLTPDRAAHLKNGKAVPGISASKRTDISITGEGIIDGNGEWWRGVKRSKVSDVEWSAYRRMGGTVTPKGDLWYPWGLKHFDNIAETLEAQEKMRTHLVRFTDCERILVQGVTIQNAPKFHLVPQRCREVTIDGVTVRCPWNAQNGDGIDLMQCRNALIVNNFVDVGDDGICLNAGTVLEDGLVSRYEIRERSCGEVMTDALHFVYLELGQMTYGAGHPERCQTKLEKLAFSLKYMRELRQRPDEMLEDIFKRLFDAAELASMDAVKRKQIDKLMTTKIDIIAGKANSYAEGMAKGEEIGVEKGIKIGDSRTSEKNARAFLKLGVSPETVAKGTGLPLEEVNELIES